MDIGKCEFEVKRVKYLGMIIDVQNGISMDPDKVEAIQNWLPPTTVKGVRGFIGFANYYRDFIQNFIDLAIPLTALAKKDVPFEWTKECENAFQTMKMNFLTGPALELASSQSIKEIWPPLLGVVRGASDSRRAELLAAAATCRSAADKRTTEFAATGLARHSTRGRIPTIKVQSAM